MTDNPTFGFLLHDSARLMRKRFEQRARGLGLSRAQWQLLFALSRNEGVQQSVLADLLDIEPITLARMVDRCQNAGLIERRPDPRDRRVWRLFLTDAAHPVLGVMQRIGAATREEALDSLSPHDRDELLRILGTLRANLAEACSRPPGDEFEVKHG